ncbi:MAG TPA: DUF397 domain-containing protein [Micromonosporaceae bacterium]|nr:DUF397 domain-containing protein [Micromonosporaceae bacterium]HCU49853.1 DUF397 domain-containing protein [Micromonosporaceae bacterium]
MTSQPPWRRSSYCEANGCFEVAPMDQYALLRDSKDPNGPQLRFSREVWNEFVDAIKRGDLEG